jgi:hypothetical protein
MFWLFLAVFFSLKIWAHFHYKNKAKREDAAFDLGYQAAVTDVEEKIRAFQQYQEKHKREQKVKQDPNLIILGLMDYPRTLDELKQARRKVMRKYHPDLGGSTNEAVAINSAYNNLLGRLAV